MVSLNTIIHLLIYFAAFFAPIGATGVRFHTPIGEVSTYRLFLFLATMMACVQCIFSRRTIFLYNQNTRYSILFLIFWVVYAAFTILWTRDFNNYVKIMFFLMTGVLCIVLISDYCEINELTNVLKALNLGLLMQCFLGYYEFFSGNYLFLKQESVDIYLSRNLHYPVAMMGNPNDFSTGMFFGIVACLYLYYIKENRLLRRVFYLTCVSVYIVVIALSNAKACLGGAIACILFFLYKKGGKSGRILAFASIFAVLVIPSINSYIFSRIDLTYFRTKGESFSIRVNLIRNGFYFLVRTLGLGVGNGQIEYWMKTSARYNTGNILNMHNWWMEILSGYGLIIFMGYMFFFFNLYHGFMTKYKHNSDSYYGKQMLVFAAALIGMILTLVGSSSNMTKEYVWLFWAVLIAFQRQSEPQLSYKVSTQ